MLNFQHLTACLFVAIGSWPGGKRPLSPCANVKTARMDGLGFHRAAARFLLRVADPHHGAAGVFRSRWKILAARHPRGLRKPHLRRGPPKFLHARARLDRAHARHRTAARISQRPFRFPRQKDPDRAAARSDDPAAVRRRHRRAADARAIRRAEFAPHTPRPARPRHHD